MNRRDFGELVAALRDDLGLTQSELAEVLEVDDSTISNIERGTRRHLGPELLFNLAHGLQLNRGERQQFYIAASGLDEERMMRPSDRPQLPAEPELLLEEPLRLIADLRIPCFVLDVYQDIIAANAITVHLLRLSVEQVEALRSIPGGLNLLWLAQRQVRAGGMPIGDAWENFAINTVRAFRENSLRYRTRPYFRYLMGEFRNPGKYSSFDRYWRLASMREAEAGVANQYSFPHSIYGQMSYYELSSMSSTPYGELFLYQLLPTDAYTAKVFADVAETEAGRIFRMAAWPDKPMP